tara:strand:+ start:649 stop:1476 length:828 start_codon:yes stop_codon:yes gene_type:complete
MPISVISQGLGIGGGASATSSGAPGGGGGGLIPGEQAVINLGPSFWVDASYADAVKSDDSGSEATATNGQDVSKWISRAGTGIELVQATASKQPIFNSSELDFGGYSTITFNSVAATDLLKDARYVDTVANVGTIFYVGKELNGDTNARIINWSTNSTSNLGTNYGAADFFVYTPLVTYGSTGSQLNAYMASISLNGASSYFSINEDTNVTFAASSDMTADIGDTAVGGTTGGSAEHASTQAAEYIIFNTALSPTNVALVETYLKNKYKGGGSFG